MSIYNAIKNAIDANGSLPQGFEIPQESTSPNELKFAVGAQDGILVYHAPHTASNAMSKEIVECLKSGNTNKITEIVNEQKAISLIDSLMDTILENKNQIDVSMLIGYAEAFAFESNNTEMVKLGIALLGMFDWSNSPEMQEKLITLGMYEEFTLYVVVAVQTWNHGNEVIFRIAKEVHGWGKIHAVSRLQPESSEIQDWILRHGCKNWVLDVYLGLACAISGNLIEALRQDYLNAELYDGVCIIINALMDEAPLSGISAYEHAEEALLRFLKFSQQYAKTVLHLWYILNIESDIQEKDLKNKDDLLKICAEIKNNPYWRDHINKVLTDPNSPDLYYAENIATRMEIS